MTDHPAPDQNHNILHVEISVSNLIEALPDALIVIDDAGLVCLANTQAELLFGYPRNHLVGMNVRDLVPDRFQITHKAYREGFMANPQVRPMGHRNMPLFAKNRVGADIPVSINLAPIMTQSGLFIITVLRRKQAYEVEP